jgi:VWFA-related protein
MKHVLIPGLAFTVLFSTLTVAQDPRPPSDAPVEADDEDAQTLTVEVDEVRVPFTVTDGDGRWVTDLTEENVRIYEDGVRQEIRSFDAQTDLPLTLVLAMDTSSSVRTKIEFEQEAAAEFFFTIIERRRDRGMLVTFDSTVQVLQDFTESPETLSEAVRDIQVGGGSAMYDAIYLAITQKVSHQPPEGRRVLIVISDGDDNDSRMRVEDALEAAQRNDVVIYTVSTNGTADFGADRQQRGDRLLEQLADETGGRTFFPFELDEVVESLEEIAEELRQQYYITYVSSNQARDGAYREIEVRPFGRNVQIRARAGYPAPRD